MPREKNKKCENTVIKNMKAKSNGKKQKKNVHTGKRHTGKNIILFV